MIAVGWCLTGDVLHGDHLAGVELLYECSCLGSIKNLGASAHTNDQHIRLTQQDTVSWADRPSGGPYMGKVETALLPVPDGGVTEASALNPVVGARESFQLEAIEPVGAWVHQEPPSGDVSSPFIGKFGTGKNHTGLNSWFRQSSCTTHSPVRIQKNRLPSALNQ